MRTVIATFALLAACGGVESNAAQDASSDAPTPCLPSVSLPEPTPPPSVHADCLADTSAFDANWQLKDDAWCIVARYDLPAPYIAGHTLTWGRHGGPLQGGPTIVRWSPPASPTGAMTSTSEDVHATLPEGMQWKDWAVDLPFDDATAIGAENPTSLGTGGEILLVRGSEVTATVATDTGSPPIGLSNDGATRLVFANIANTKSTPTYAISIESSDDCHSGVCATTPVESPSLNPDVPLPVFVDPNGDVFAAFEEARGAPGTFEHLLAYERTRIAPHACPTVGTSAEIFGNIVPAADGTRVYYGAQDNDQGIETISYAHDASSAITFGARSSFVVPSSGGWYFGALLVDDHARLWALSVVDKTSTFWVFARR